MRLDHPQYHNQPVAPWGAADAHLLIVGLAPGKHGANATGYPFTGDASGELLFRVLHRTGFSSHSRPAPVDTTFRLNGCRITNAVKCLPPGNKPAGDEIRQCGDYLLRELQSMVEPGVIVALGRLAHGAIIRTLGLRQVDFPFAHGMHHNLDNSVTLLDSYHCSRYNTQTGRLTESMLFEVFRRAADLARQVTTHEQ